MAKRIGGVVLLVAVVVVLIIRFDTNGWGSFVWLAMGAAINIIRAPHASANAENNIVRKDEEKTENVLLFAVFFGGNLLPFIHLMTGVFSFADYDLAGWTPAIGVSLTVPGLYLFWRSHTDLGRNWSVTTELREDHTLVTDGIYRTIRHPMYTAIWLFFLAYPFIIHNWIAGWAVIVAFAAMCMLRIPYEESMMVDRFGDEYRSYMAKTGRLVPRLRGA